MLTVISCNWAPGEAGNSSGQIMEKPLSHSDARKTNFQHFSGQKLMRLQYGIDPCTKSPMDRVRRAVTSWREYGIDYQVRTINTSSMQCVIPAG